MVNNEESIYHRDMVRLPQIRFKPVLKIILAGLTPRMFWLITLGCALATGMLLTIPYLQEQTAYLPHHVNDCDTWPHVASIYGIDEIDLRQANDHYGDDLPDAGTEIQIPLIGPSKIEELWYRVQLAWQS